MFSRLKIWLMGYRRYTPAIQHTKSSYDITHIKRQSGKDDIVTQYDSANVEVRK